VLFGGGVDIEPCHYHEGIHAKLEEADPRLDELELTLAHLALQQDMPILGVCRGMQLLNVALGGNLYQDLDEQYPGTLRHCRRDLPRNTLIHSVHVEAGSRMEEILGTNEIWVNSLHHQAVKEPGKDVHISGRAEDGVAELLEVSNYRFVMGIQGHPEEIYIQEPTCARLFSAFVEACSDRSGNFAVYKLPMVEEATVNT